MIHTVRLTTDRGASGQVAVVTALNNHLTTNGGITLTDRTVTANSIPTLLVEDADQFTVSSKCIYNIFIFIDMILVVTTVLCTSLLVSLSYLTFILFKVIYYKDLL